jgi:putative ABC transport system permease protein
MAHYLGFACVGLVLALVSTTTVMAVQDRVKEHAVLQTLGLRPLRIFRLVLVESVIQSLIGGVLGIGFAMTLLAWGGFSVGAEGVTIAFRPSVELGVTGAAVSLVVGVLAGMVPGWQAAQANIVVALRQA